MAKTARTWQIILALQEQLQAITVANGYLTDLGQNVWISDAQRTDEDALGVMIYSGNIAGADPDRARPGKPVRRMTVHLECAISTALDDAQERIHTVIEDLERCVSAYAKVHAQGIPDLRALPPMVDDIAVLDRPEGTPVIAMQMQLTVEYFR